MHGDTIVFFHAHPDDEAIFTGLTMRRLADAGARVVLATATSGELGEALIPLDPGETTAARRQRELEAACAELGVSRLVLFGRRDSGMAGWTDNDHPDALAAACRHTLARRLATICDEEGAAALVHGASAGQLSPYGRVTVEIPLAVAADDRTLEAKRRAMAVHASQIPSAALDLAGFADVYGLEWYLRDGPAGVVDRLGNVHAIV